MEPPSGEKEEKRREEKRRGMTEMQREVGCVPGLVA
jgi:hypothetical protein